MHIGPTPASALHPVRLAIALHELQLGGLTVQRERNAFVSQVRIPIASLFGGRLQLAALHQRLRAVNQHSGVLLADASAPLRAQPGGLNAVRTRASWGGGIWFQIGRPRS